MTSSGRVPVLTFVNGERKGEVFPLSQDTGVLVGRSPEADLVLRDDSVSRKHVRFYQEQGGLWLRDLGSRNGTRVNGSQVARYRLSSGDRVAVGATLLRVGWVAQAEFGMPKREDSTGRAMSGSLEDIPLADVLQWLATSRKSGVLRVHGPRQGFLSLSEGRVRTARLEGVDVHSPEKALLRMMRWNEGTFELSSAEPADDDAQELSLSLEHILMEAARQHDELQHLAETKELPRERVMLRFPPQTPWRSLGPDTLDLLELIASAQTCGQNWDDILCASEIDDLTLTKRVLELQQSGLVHFDGTDEQHTM